MRVTAVLLFAILCLTAANVAREAAGNQDGTVDEPYAPSPKMARIAVLGYDEAAADIMFIRLLGYFGRREATANGVSTVVEAVVALDPSYHRVYEYGSRAMTIAGGATQETYLRALGVLDRGMEEFPQDWKLPNLAGQIYTQDLETTDPAQRRAWDEKGLLLTESSLRKPGASPEAATWAATMRTKFGQHDRAVRELRELILLTPDAEARQRMIEKLATLEHTDQAELAGELYEQQHALEAKRRRERPGVPPQFYILIGPRIKPGFDMTDLATGGADLVGSDPVEKLEPLE